MTAAALFEQVVVITQEYLGPAAERFIIRLITAHFGKSPEELRAKDIPKLSEWVKVSLGLLTDDKSMVDECQRRILKLT